MSLEWNGDKVADKVKAAQKQGLLRTVSDCLEDAKDLVHIRTGTLQRSIKTEGVQEDKEGLSILWGSWDVNYAFWQEVLPESKGGKAYLRPSADKNYPKLGEYIRKSM
jgi:hypothetical protein